MRSLTPFRSLSRSPFRMFDSFDRDMDRMLNLMDMRTPSLSSFDVDTFVPTYDMVDKDTHFVLSFDVPGVPKEDIHIDMQEGQLHISGERRYQKEDVDYTERSYGRFERTIALPTNIDTSKVDAHYENGVLSIALPKTEESKAKKIAISEGKKEGLWNRLLAPKSTIDVKSGRSESKAA